MTKNEFLKKSRETLRGRFTTYAVAAAAIGVSTTHLSNALAGKVTVPPALLKYMGYKCIKTHDFIKVEND